MTLIETIDRLDKLVLDRAPITEQRTLINSIRETLEAYDKDAAAYAAFKVSTAKQIDDLQAENEKLKNPPPPESPNFGFSSRRTGL